ncbi:MAG: flagellar basal body rod protein FlgC [Planctomycetota bacterium]
MASAFDISASALYAQRVRMDSIAENLANANTIRNAQNQYSPYQRRFVIFQTGDPATGSQTEGVHVSEILKDKAAFVPRYEPGHPDADAEGNVYYPNVNPLVEMVNMIDATRAYEMNVTALDATKGMNQASLRILA